MRIFLARNNLTGIINEIQKNCKREKTIDNLLGKLFVFELLYILFIFAAKKRDCSICNKGILKHVPVAIFCSSYFEVFPQKLVH